MRIQLGIKLESHRATREAFHGGLEDPWHTSAKLDAYPETEKLQSGYERTKIFHMKLLAKMLLRLMNRIAAESLSGNG